MSRPSYVDDLPSNGVTVVVSNGSVWVGTNESDDDPVLVGDVDATMDLRDALQRAAEHLEIRESQDERLIGPTEDAARRDARNTARHLSAPALDVLQALRGGKDVMALGLCDPRPVEELISNNLADDLTSTVEVTPWGHYVGAVAFEEAE